MIYMGMKVHIYSDLNLRYNQYTNPEDEYCPNVDLIFVPGNISNHIKRSLLFQETATKFAPVVVNIGLFELSNWEFFKDAVNAMDLRYSTQRDIRCHFNLLNSVILEEQGLDILQLVGFPKVQSNEEIARLVLDRFVTKLEHGRQYDENGVLIGQIKTKDFPYRNTTEDINSLYAEEYDRIKSWTSIDNGLKKVLLLGNKPDAISTDFDLKDVTVISTGTEFVDQPFRQGRWICNPGSGTIPRSRVFEI